MTKLFNKTRIKKVTSALSQQLKQEAKLSLG